MVRPTTSADESDECRPRSVTNALARGVNVKTVLAQLLPGAMPRSTSPARAARTPVPVPLGRRILLEKKIVAQGEHSKKVFERKIKIRGLETEMKKTKAEQDPNPGGDSHRSEGDH